MLPAPRQPDNAAKAGVAIAIGPHRKKYFDAIGVAENLAYTDRSAIRPTLRARGQHRREEARALGIGRPPFDR